MLSVFNLLLLFFICFSGYFFARSMKSKTIALIPLTTLTCCFSYFLLNWKGYGNDKKFTACFLVILLLPALTLKFCPVFIKKLFRRITSLGSENHNVIACSLENELYYFLCAFDDTDYLLMFADFVWKNFGAQKKEFLKDILVKTVKPVPWRSEVHEELLQYFREEIKAAKDEAETTEIL